jgi:hypothetical protein
MTIFDDFFVLNNYKNGHFFGLFSAFLSLFYIRKVPFLRLSHTSILAIFDKNGPFFRLPSTKKGSEVLFWGNFPLKNTHPCQSECAK